MTLRWAEVPNLASSTGESCRDGTGCRSPKAGNSRRRSSSTAAAHQDAATRKLDSLAVHVKPAPRCAPDKSARRVFPTEPRALRTEAVQMPSAVDRLQLRVPFRSLATAIASARYPEQRSAV